ncbi:hypothetical protein AZ09_07100 [Acetobacter aceti 1023]|nr:hypothetical protein AZ09_07100 [Acetobacter aceti 1023]
MNVGIYPGFELCSFEELPDKRSLVAIVGGGVILYGIRFNPKIFIDFHINKFNRKNYMYFIYHGNEDIYDKFYEIKESVEGIYLEGTYAVSQK